MSGEFAAGLQRTSHAALVGTVDAVDDSLVGERSLEPDIDLDECCKVSDGSMGIVPANHVSCTYEVVLLALSVLGHLWSVDGVGDRLGGCDGCARRRRLLYIDNS